jgi:dynein heavy chain
MNLSKFIAQDIPLFQQLLKDIFPKQTKIEKMVYKDVEGELKKIMKANNLDDRPDWVIKII